MQYKKLKSDSSPDVVMNDYITINRNPKDPRLSNNRIISLFYNNRKIIDENDRRYRGYRYVNWFKL